MGISLTAFFRRFAHVDLSIRTVIAAHITFCIAFVVVVVKARLTAFDNRLVEAAADLGATPVQAFLRVVLPLAAPGIFAGAMLAFTISLDDVVITSFTAGPGSTTLPLYIFGQLRFGVSPSINALSTIVLLSPRTAGHRRILQREGRAARRRRHRCNSTGVDQDETEAQARHGDPGSALARPLGAPHACGTGRSRHDTADLRPARAGRHRRGRRRQPVDRPRRRHRGRERRPRASRGRRGDRKAGGGLRPHVFPGDALRGLRRGLRAARGPHARKLTRSARCS